MLFHLLTGWLEGAGWEIKCQSQIFKAKYSYIEIWNLIYWLFKIVTAFFNTFEFEENKHFESQTKIKQASQQIKLLWFKQQAMSFFPHFVSVPRSLLLHKTK